MSTLDFAFSMSASSLSGRVEIDSLLFGYQWGTNGGSRVELSYSFGSAGVSAYRAGYATPDPGSAWTLSATATDSVRRAIGAWTSVANIVCTEIADTATECGDLRFGGSAVPERAYTVMVGADLPEAGDVWFGTFFADPSLSWAPGSYAYLTTVHEVGHALGLKHTHEEANGAPSAPESIDSQLHSVMSYRSYIGAPLTLGYWQDRFPTTPMVNDIRAIQHLYGANMATNAGDTVYSWQPGQGIFETIWDGGGNDTISWANQTDGARIDLRPGSYSELGPAWSAGFLLEPRTLGIAYDCWIENAVGGSGADVLIGNDLGNVLSGGAGDDSLTGGAGNDLLDGGSGTDTALFESPSTFYGILHTGAGEVTVTGPQGTDILRGIERLSFADVTLALNGDASSGTMASTFFAIADSASGTRLLQEASVYSGPVQGLQWQLIGSDGDEAVTGGAGNDFVNGLRGTDAINGGGGDDVLDGGAGSNFLTGGAGRDVFFLDGRNGEPVWSTVTDLDAGEMVTLWGWQAGVSTLSWAEMGGADGYRGATAHVDFDADGGIDASLTLSGRTAASLAMSPGAVQDTGYLAVWLQG